MALSSGPFEVRPVTSRRGRQTRIIIRPTAHLEISIPNTDGAPLSESASTPPPSLSFISGRGVIAPSTAPLKPDIGLMLKSQLVAEGPDAPGTSLTPDRSDDARPGARSRFAGQFLRETQNRTAQTGVEQGSVTGGKFRAQLRANGSAEMNRFAHRTLFVTGSAFLAESASPSVVGRSDRPINGADGAPVSADQDLEGAADLLASPRLSTPSHVQGGLGVGTETAEPEGGARHTERPAPPMLTLVRPTRALTVIDTEKLTRLNSTRRPGVRVSGREEGREENEPCEAPPRNYDCEHYESCLSLAAVLDWQSFTCQGCNGTVDERLLWRAHHLLKQSPTLAKLCPLPVITSK